MRSNAPSYAVLSPRKVSKTSITSLKPLVDKTISIRKNQGGVTYKDLFGNYLRTVKEICITAPFIRQPYQIRLKSQKSERISPFWVGGYPPFSASIARRSCSYSPRLFTSPVVMNPPRCLSVSIILLLSMPLLFSCKDTTAY